VLWLYGDNPTMETNLRKEALARGVAPQRVIYADHIPNDQYLKRISYADFGLDTRTYNGGTISSNTLWAGVPLVTLQGGHFASRMASSILTHIGLPELVTTSLKDYEDLAVHYATNPAAYQALKQKLQKNILIEPLFDTPRFVRTLENAYTQVWDQFVSGQKPEHIMVKEVAEKKPTAKRKAAK
jgi:protein O-GlcNAc transferase